MIELKHLGNIAFQLLIKSNEGKLNIPLNELIAYQLTPVPYSLGMADGFLTKTDKSKAFHSLKDDIENVDPPTDGTTLTIIDGNAVFHSLAQIPHTFRQISEKFFELLPKGDVVFGTDSYHEGSIKAMERKRRGTGEKIILSGEAMKRPGDWPGFLANDENKSQLVGMLLQV